MKKYLWIRIADLLYKLRVNDLRSRPNSKTNVIARIDVTHISEERGLSFNFIVLKTVFSVTSAVIVSYC